MSTAQQFRDFLSDNFSKIQIFYAKIQHNILHTYVLTLSGAGRNPPGVIIKSIPRDSICLEYSNDTCSLRLTAAHISSGSIKGSEIHNT